MEKHLVAETTSCECSLVEKSQALVLVGKRKKEREIRRKQDERKKKQKRHLVPPDFSNSSGAV